MQNKRSIPWLDISYYAAIVIMILETAYVAYSVMQTGGDVDKAGALRVVLIPALFEVFVVGLVAEADKQAGRGRVALWAAALLALGGAAVVQAGAMAAHPADAEMAARMGVLYGAVRLVIAVMGPLVVGAAATIKLWKSSLTVRALRDTLTALRAEIEGLRVALRAAEGAALTADRTTADMTRRLEAAVREIEGLRADLAEARKAVRVDPQPALNAGIEVDLAEVRRMRVCEGVSAGQTTAQIAAALGVSASQVEKDRRVLREAGRL